MVHFPQLRVVLPRGQEAIPLPGSESSSRLPPRATANAPLTHVVLPELILPPHHGRSVSWSPSSRPPLADRDVNIPHLPDQYRSTSPRVGHWSLILQGVLVKASWVEGAGCVVTSTNNTILAATFIYSMIFDLFVLLSMYKLVLGIKGGRSQLMTLLIKDSLLFHCVCVLPCLIGLRPIRSIIADWARAHTHTGSSSTCLPSCSSC